VAIALAASACSNSAAIGSARAACGHIDASLRTYAKATAAGVTPQAATTLMSKAQSQLLAALPDAANATSIDGSYNSLMTTIQEADRVPEGLLVPSLRRQCQIVTSNSPYLGL
jgi:hypothetical protein